VPVEAGVLELDSGRTVTVRDESDIDPAGLVGIGVVVEGPVEVPRQGDVAGRIPRQHAPPLALGAVDATLVPSPTDPRFDHRLGHLGAADVMPSRPPGIEAVGEHRKRPLDRRVHRDGRAEGRVGRDHESP
jgi:hypothetical protein